MRSLRRRRGSLRTVIWIGAAILAITAIGLASGLLQSPSWLDWLTTEGAPATESISDELTQPASAATASVSSVDVGVEPTVSVTLIGPPSAADTWANALLDRVLVQLLKTEPPGDGFAWWQGKEAIGTLGFDGRSLSFRGEPLSINEQMTLTISIVSPVNSNQTQRIASLRVESSALTIFLSSSQPDRGDMQWILSGSQPDTALESLVVQAAARSVALNVAYNPTSEDGGATLVLVGARPLTTAAPTMTPSGTPPTATAAITAAPPTPTHIPEASLGVVVEAKLKPVIDIGLSFPPDVVADYVAAHAWNGPLTWDESGPKVDERPVNVNAAVNMTFLILTPNDPRGPAQPFLRLEYSGNATRFLDEQMYFTGQRMEEVLYWMVSYGAKRGGLLVVTYDDFGSRQSITIVGFTPFTQSGTQTSNP